MVLRVARCRSRAATTVLPHGERRVEACLLEGAAEAGDDAAMRWEIRDVDVADDDAAIVGSLEAGDQIEERGLSGAVVADEADDASGPNLEGRRHARP